MNVASNSVDVVIVGAGMVGATAALALAREGVRVAVLEAASLADALADTVSWQADSYDLRVSALSCATQRLFTALGAWSELAQLGVTPFRSMYVWDSRGDGRVQFDASAIAEPALGHIAQNRNIQRALLRAVVQQPTAALCDGAAVAAIDVHSDHVDVATANGERWNAKLVIGADGNRSRVRSLAAMAVRGWSYDQMGLVATVRTAKPHRDTAWQRFLPEGPLAFLPLGNDICSIVWSTSPHRSEQLLALNDRDFNLELGDAIEHALGEVEVVGPRAAFPLKLEHATRYVQNRIALIGDAAHTVHPLAGQGANLGFLDAAALSQVLVEGAGRGQDLGGANLLRRYERWRKGDNLLTLGVMDGFKRAFVNQSATLRIARNFGFNVVDKLPAVKNIFMQHAMGLRGDLPQLCKPMSFDGQG